MNDESKLKLMLEPVETTRLNLHCECGGVYKFNSEHESKFKHTCNGCDNIVHLDHEHPRIFYTTQTHMNLTTDMLGTSLFN